MIEEAEHPFPPPEENASVNHVDDETSDKNEILPDIIEETIDGDQNEKFDTRVVQEKMDTEMDPKRKSTINDNFVDVAEDQVTESVALPISSSTGSDGETTGPSTADNSLTQTVPAEEEIAESPKLLVGGRASIPDELEPHQLAQLQDLKESNA